MIPCLWLIRFLLYGSDPLAEGAEALPLDQPSAPL